jgi:hypothetical protein
MDNKISDLMAPLKPYALILTITGLFTALLWANPGYFNHDEWQKFDYVSLYGLKSYVKTFVHLHTASSFGVPVRPLSFGIQGLLAPFTESYPVLLHGADVLSHGVVACLLYALVRRFGGTHALALVSAIIFACSPLAMLATGWSAALMDRYYILFGALALLSAHAYVLGSGKIIHLFTLLVTATCAMLSKETAIVLPALMVIILFAQPHSIKTRKFWIAGIIWSLPVILFLLLRLPGIVNSFSHTASGSYSASPKNIFNNLYVYLSYPFLVDLTGAGNFVFVHTPTRLAAIAAHFALVLVLLRKFGLMKTGLYCGLYVLFLVPVLFIPSKGAHYLYGSGLVLSVALAAILVDIKTNPVLSRIFALALMGVLLWHSVKIQLSVYRFGTCMERAMTSTEALFLSNGHPKAIDFRAEPGAPGYVLNRTYFGRNQITGERPIRFSFSKWGAEFPKDALVLVMNKQCLVYKP